jgi:hypothetical protein
MPSSFSGSTRKPLTLNMKALRCIETSGTAHPTAHRAKIVTKMWSYNGQLYPY